MLVPETRYTQSGGVHVAYQVFGEGTVDIVVVPGWFSNVEIIWEVGRFGDFLRELATFARVILFDKRGTGLSDRDSHAYVLEDRMDDVRAVMDAADSERAVLYGSSEGGALCVVFAATYPQRTESLILMSSYARRLRAPDYPWGQSPESYQQVIDRMETDWTSAIGPGQRVPSLADDESFRKQWAKYMRQSASPSTAAHYARMNGEIDIRAILPSVQVPALIVCAARDRVIAPQNSKYLADHIPQARLVEIDSDDHNLQVVASRPLLDEVRRFTVGECNRRVMTDRVVFTVMFTDIVGSTRLATELGDQRWSALLEQHHSMIRSELDNYRGHEIKTTGDGFHAVFDGPARGIQCARRLIELMKTLGIGLRVGLHTGECVVSDNDLEGIAVHIAARVADAAGEGDVLVSQTVRDLVAGSGIAFIDRGIRDFKGIPDSWHLYAVDNS